ncbi:hypothetical protein BDA96_09G099100 [Sorghum bicolor]|uniref:Uncharacterized protein n=2 Tax=Sorghum bicolor TaxID=4558 RepID=A0A921QB72_SORBI|nr:hypothetical protein BDA96_09G099100 [Sorghum bicolor]KXG21674.1 hypothetical protein SORBI_3009G094200 [Sorghum bicolor]
MTGRGRGNGGSSTSHPHPQRALNLSKKFQLKSMGESKSRGGGERVLCSFQPRSKRKGSPLGLAKPSGHPLTRPLTNGRSNSNNAPTRGF